MRWLIILWLLLLATTHLYFPVKSFSDSRKGISTFEKMSVMLSNPKYSGEKAQAYGQLNDAINRLDSMLFSTVVKSSYVIIMILGLMAMVSGFMLASRKEIGVKLGLITLTLMLLWGIHVSFSKEAYKRRMKSEYQTIYQSVRVLSEKELEFSPKLEQELKPKLVGSLSFQAVALIFLSILFLRRKTIVGNKNPSNTLPRTGSAACGGGPSR